MRTNKDALRKLLTYNEKPCEIRTNSYTISVYVCGNEAMHSIPNNWDDDDMNNLSRCLHYNPETVSHIACSILSSFQYLLSCALSEKEAARRLKILRYAYQNHSKRPEALKPDRELDGAPELKKIDG
jgi:hypothetical protein